MKAHIIFAHPEPKSFNGKLVEISRNTLEENGHQTTVSDLYAMDFDPREGAQHYATRKDADVFHAQSEQRFHANMDTLPTRASVQYNADIEFGEDKRLRSDAPVYSPFMRHASTCCFPVTIKQPNSTSSGVVVLRDRSISDRVFRVPDHSRQRPKDDSGKCVGPPTSPP